MSMDQKSFLPAKQGSPCRRGAVKSGVVHKLHIDTTGLFHECQEILSRYGPAFSLEPTCYPGWQIFLQWACEDLVSDHDPAAGA